ncbi:hypothetical protein ACFW04_013895 [Cataglyphis niger]
MLFLKINANLRTNENFVNQQNAEHHIGRSIFERANLGMVNQFPLDYMHLVCLGIIKKLLQTFIILINPSNFFHYPINSKLFNIIVGNE